jgi:hypothetical protein
MPMLVLVTSDILSPVTLWGVAAWANAGAATSVNAAAAHKVIAHLANAFVLMTDSLNRPDAQKEAAAPAFVGWYWYRPLSWVLDHFGPAGRESARPDACKAACLDPSA